MAGCCFLRPQMLGDEAEEEESEAGAAFKTGGSSKTPKKKPMVRTFSLSPLKKFLLRSSRRSVGSLRSQDAPSFGHFSQKRNALRSSQRKIRRSGSLPTLSLHSPLI